MKQTRHKFTPEFKTKVVLEALSERLSLTELAQKHELHPTQIAQWKREFLDKASEVFSKGEKAQKTEQDYQQESEELYKTIGQLKENLGDVHDLVHAECRRDVDDKLHYSPLRIRGQSQFTELHRLREWIERLKVTAIEPG